MLEVEGLIKRYGAKTVLDGVSFAIGKQGVVGFLGVNGAGKSTAMRILSGYLRPSSGRARVAGGDPRTPAVRKKIGYLPEGNPLPSWMRVGEYLRFRAALKGLSRAAARRRAAETAARCRLEDLMDRLIGSLSKGTRQRVGLADSLLAHPDILILDEPTSGLDPAQAEEMRTLILEIGQNSAVFLSSHLLQDVERLCRRVIILNGGRVAADGDMAEIGERHAGERTLRLEIEADEPILETLLAVPGVAGGEAIPNPAGSGFLVRLILAAGRDARREAAAAAIQKGWLVTGIRLEPVRLEDVFRRLALAEAPPIGTEGREKGHA
ncbi:MAG: ABC transporter ATP-binding protein [Planctomycetota bacterium]|jgi:ABC-2 type transport system ATP-binding protein|nr:ABC transporter ATP-binding protein [Planctomycetota bacterium]